MRRPPISRKLFAGAAAPSPLAGLGRELIAQAATLEDYSVDRCGEDVYLRGRV